MTENGWFKIHRKILQHPRFKQDGWMLVWIYLLGTATHKDWEVIFGKNERITLKPGQLITGSLKIAAETGLSRSKVERILKGMEIEQQIGQRTCSKGRLISITNWDEHQQSEQQSGQRVDSGRTAGGQRVDTNKKDKNNKKVKNTLAETQAIAWSSAGGWEGITDSDLKDWAEAYPACDLTLELAKMREWLKSNPEKSKKKLWRRFITSWLGRSQERGGGMKTNGHDSEKREPNWL